MTQLRDKLIEAGVAVRDTTHAPPVSRPSPVANVIPAPDPEGLQALKNSLLLDLTMFALKDGYLAERGRHRNTSRYCPKWYAAYALEREVRAELALIEEEIPTEPDAT